MPEQDEPRVARGRKGDHSSRWSRLAVIRDPSRWREDPLVPAVLGVAAVMLVLVAGAFVAWQRCAPGGWCPDPRTLDAYLPAGSPVLLDRHGEEITDLHPLQQRVIALDSLPAHLPAAVLAVEDRRFESHRGVDWLRVPSSALQGQGGSTITMQLARTLFPDLLPRDQRTFRRKAQEIRVARVIEGAFEKDQILELYINHVYLGAGRYGVEDASRYFFARSAVDLELEQAALLAGMARAPAHYDPRLQPERALERRNLVLRLMEEQGRVSPEAAGAARDRPLGVSDTPLPRVAHSVAPYFVEAVRWWLEARFDEELMRSPARIHTTLDLSAQTIAEEEILAELERIESGEHGAFSDPAAEEAPEGEEARGPNGLQGAVVFIDPVGGDLLALVGGRDYESSSYDRATLSRRQTGSAFKPFVYAAALREGFLQSQPIADLPFEVTIPNSAPWSPRNYDGQFRGHTNMREALVHSINVPAARMAMAVGLESVVETAHQAGVEAPVPATPATALGAAALTPLELGLAFAPFATLGERPTLRLVTRVEGFDGEVLHEEEPHRQEGMDPRIAYIVTDMLKDVVNRGTAASVRQTGFAGVAAGKTGTTQDAHDVWFVGYAPDILGVVWVGFDQPRPIVPGATGGRIAAPTWGRMMSRIREARPEPDDWAMPSGIVATGVDRETGMYVEDGCSPGEGGMIRVLFLEEYQPSSVCPQDDGWIDRLRTFLGGGRAEEDERSTLPPGYSAFELGAPVERILGAARVPSR